MVVKINASDTNDKRHGVSNHQSSSPVRGLVHVDRPFSASETMESKQAEFVTMLMDRLHSVETKLESLEKELEVQRARVSTLEEDNKQLWPADPSRLVADHLRFMLATGEEAFLELDYVRTNANGTWNDDTIDEELNRVRIFNYAFVSSWNPQRRSLLHRDALLIEWNENIVPEGFAPLEAMTLWGMQAAGLAQKLLEGPQGYRLYELHIREEDSDYPYWVTSDRRSNAG